MARTRPTGVTVVAIIVLIDGALTTLGAILGLMTGGHTASLIVSLILGILTMLVSAGLFARSQIARVITTIVLALSLVGAIYSMGAAGFGSMAVIWPLITALLSLAAIALLYTRQANAFFR